MEIAKPLIVICDVLQGPGGFSMLKSMCPDLLRAVHARARVVQPATPKAFIDALKQQPRAVLVTDPDVLSRLNPPSPHAALFDYVRFGGTMVICGPFSNNSRPDEMQQFFKAWKLPWKLGSYLRTSFVLGSNLNGTGDLPQNYNVKAQLMRAPEDSRIYVPASGAQSQSHVFASRNVANDEVPVVRSPCGSGTVGFAGDVNCEKETTPIVLWLAGLAAEEAPKHPVAGFATFDITFPTGKQKTVAIGRGGRPFVWHLLDAAPGGEMVSTFEISSPAPNDEDDGEFSTTEALASSHAFWEELSRVGAVDPGNGLTMARGKVVSMRMKVLVPASERVRWCAGCGKWEANGGQRYMACSVCRSRFYCSTQCQKNDWRAEHKRICELLKAGKEKDAQIVRLANAAS
ncbi:hypothetical protein EXIGLDRAFT_638478 [Exidia glandulosa HHB12029]|uniref:MYND-type domain-containing protein n=1 Tax=Exidia glandulosa HHB12029 TaxID=1314781 RepID=A0A165NSX5_EXIGL|nr:hypothetical protein EXIGLDRAFT_638478 [Exidia glandulosa HHB12029]